MQRVELVRAGRDPADLAREFEPSAGSIAHWVAQAESGFHAWRHRAPSARAVADAALLNGRQRIARLMRAAGLVGASRRHSGVTTTRRDRAARPAPELVDRAFTAAADAWSDASMCPGEVTPPQELLEED